ncbi:MAG TPA: BPSS1780 family membrane protein [Azospira sp.]|nr:BPSS1780 family membrane protein [Azospira sp.]HNN07313.1 BPSS1780 family membrane protein [Azospira sp.]HNN44998.1 BPSS1780 family membrane protein [Azospira sp.]
MQAKKLTAGDGWRWLGGGFALFRKNPPMLTLVIMAYWLTLAMTNIIPLLGPVIATLAIPAFSVSLMNAVRKLDNGQPLELPILFSGFRKELKTLIVLGGLYLATSLTALGASALADGGLFLQTMIGSYKPSPEELASGEFLAAAQIALILMAPVIMAWWYAPVLVAWHGFSAGKALFFSLFACLRNWRAFFAYTACALFFGGILPGILLGVLVAIVPGAASVASTLFMLPLMFVLAPTLVASFYVSYRDVFTDSELAVVTDEAGDTFPPPPPEDHA